jgi:methionine-rich copper-binding protein CopC
VLALVLLGTWLAPAAWAHGELVASSPAPGETVGRASHIDLVFSTEIFDFEVTVTKPDGTQLAGTAVKKAPPYISFEAVPLVDEGEYVVVYSGTDTDGDRIENAYAFSVEAGAGPPAPLPVDLSVFAESEETSIWFYVIVMAGVVVVAVLAGLLAERLRKLRQLRA